MSNNKPKYGEASLEKKAEQDKEDEDEKKKEDKKTESEEKEDSKKNTSEKREDVQKEESDSEKDEDSPKIETIDDLSEEERENVKADLMEELKGDLKSDILKELSGSEDEEEDKNEDNSLGANIKDDPVGGVNLNSRALATKKRLKKQPKKGIMIPLNPKEKKGEAFQAVTINGYRFRVMKGVMVEVPKDVYKLIESSQNMDSTQHRSITKDYNLSNADKTTRQALSR